LQLVSAQDRRNWIKWIRSQKYFKGRNDSGLVEYAKLVSNDRSDEKPDGAHQPGAELHGDAYAPSPGAGSTDSCDKWRTVSDAGRA
jgi:hypothetical protein